MRVQAKTLKAFAGIVWLAVGAGLFSVGLRFVFGWHDPESVRTPLGIASALGVGVLVGVLKGTYVLSRTARRNIKRIQCLLEPRIWQVFTGKFLILILCMMGLGRGLRALAARGYLGGYLGVGGIYVGLGLALAVAALAYFMKPPAAMPTRIDALPTGVPVKHGVLLVNLGSPDAPTTPAVRRFLRQFLSDRRVVEVNRALWAFVLNVIILPFRSPGSAALYRAIWTPEGSPLIVNGKALLAALRERLGPEPPLALGMRYGNPSLAAGLAELRDAGCSDVYVVPLFPQFSNTTTGSVIAEVTRLVSLERDPLRVEFARPCFDDPAYIEALAQVAAEHPTGDFTVFSFHGIPESYDQAGDPYRQQCGRTAWLLAERLGLARDQWELVFQSQFGDEPWLQPYLDEYVRELAASYPKVRVMAPSFAADCLETLEEIGESLREEFEERGGQELIVVPALNAHPAWVEVLAQEIAHQAHA